MSEQLELVERLEKANYLDSLITLVKLCREAASALTALQGENAKLQKALNIVLAKLAYKERKTDAT